MEDFQGAYLSKKNSTIYFVIITLTWYLRHSSKNTIITRVILVLVADVCVCVCV